MGSRNRPRIAETVSPANQPMPGSTRAAAKGLPPTVAPMAPMKAEMAHMTTATTTPSRKSRMFNVRPRSKKKAPTISTTNGMTKAPRHRQVQYMFSSPAANTSRVKIKMRTAPLSTSPGFFSAKGGVYFHPGKQRKAGNIAFANPPAIGFIMISTIPQPP
jgi:hypothetical protein